MGRVAFISSKQVVFLLKVAHSVYCNDLKTQNKVPAKKNHCT